MSTRSLIENLLTDAYNSLKIEMIEQGADPESEEVQEQLSTKNLKSLPEIEDFFSKDYRSLVEEWASHQLNVDEERFTISSAKGWVGITDKYWLTAIVPEKGKNFKSILTHPQVKKHMEEKFGKDWKKKLTDPNPIYWKELSLHH